jgi:eukaryotic-like serine/threonine-protein kinase
MDGARWDRIQMLFHEAADLPAPQRPSFLKDACQDDAVMTEVLAMLEEDSRGASLLDSGVANAAHDRRR